MSREGFKVPNYLLKTSYGEKLQRKLTGPVAKVEQQENILERLSASGLMGNMPSRYIASGYDSELVDMLNRTTSVNSPYSVIENIESARSLAEANRDDDYGDSIHYNNDLMDIDVQDNDDPNEQFGNGDNLDDISNRSLPIRRSSRKKSDASPSLSNSNESNQVKYPLPTQWTSTPDLISTKNSHGLELSVDNNSRHDSESSVIKSNYNYYVTRADNEIPIEVGIYYFEIKVTSVTNPNVSGSCDISIGFRNAGESRTVVKMPGLEIGSYGFSGSDGKITANQSNVQKTYSEGFGLDDVIGCCINYYKRHMFFTKNGVNLGVAFYDIWFGVFPIIGFVKNGNSVVTNFGTNGEEFLFDIEGYISQQKLMIERTILNFSNINEDDSGELDNRKGNKYTNQDIPSILQKLVGSYFEHLGYVDVSRVFKQEVLEEQNSENSDENSINFDEESLRARQLIRKYLMDGDIDKCIELTNSEFPDVLTKNREIFFKLQCNKFIELIKKNKIDESMEFGQVLRLKFSDSKYQSFLNDIFGLIAYENPLESELGYLLKTEELYKISDELNSEILKSLGKSSVSNIETFLKHNQLLLEQLNKQQTPGSFLITNQDFKL